MADMKLKDYEEYFEEAGISLPTRLLHRYKKIIYHLDVTQDYLEGRLEEDMKWWAAAISGSTRVALMTKEGTSKEAAVHLAKEELQEILSVEGKARRAERLASWLGEWYGKTGLARLRNSLNTRLYAIADQEEDKLVRIPVMSPTRDRLTKLMGLTGDQQSYDAMLNKLIGFYSQMHGFDIFESTDAQDKKGPSE